MIPKAVAPPIKRLSESHARPTSIGPAKQKSITAIARIKALNAGLAKANLSPSLTSDIIFFNRIGLFEM